MNLSLPFIRRPVMTTLLTVFILLAGILGYRLLPVNNLPNVDFPTISVSASLPGASPETMAASVATPLERQFSTIPGLESMTSSSTQDSTSITLQFNLDRPIDAAAQDVQTAIAAATRRLPDGMPNPPTYRKVNPAEQPILFLSLNSPTLPLSQVDEYADTFVAQRLSTINGVAQVSVYGSQKYAVRAQLDPAALASRGIGFDEVANAIQQGNSNAPTGTLYGPLRTYAVESDGQLSDAADFRRLVVAYRNGAPVRLQELGNVLDSVENDKVASWFNGTRGIMLAVQRQPGTNTIEVANQVEKLLPTLRAQLPASVNLELVYNRAESIRTSVDDVQFTLVLTILLVVLVIFLFLRNLRATIIPSLALPVSLLGTFFAMHLLHFNLDTISLMALTLSTGFIVDDAIVMLENIVRHLEMGETPLEAAIKGAKEISFTILAMTLSLVAVFIPILFMGGILGRLFNEFAITIGVAILVSCFVSLTLTPMLGSRFLRGEQQSENRFSRALEAGFQAILALYERGLRLVLDHRLAALLISGILVVLTGFCFVWVPKGFIPVEDIDQIMGTTEAIQGISFQEMTRHQRMLETIIRENKNVEALTSSVGAGGRNGAGNSGSFMIRLKPRSERRIDSDGVIQQLRPKLARVPGIKVFLQTPPSIRIGGRSSKSLYQLTLKSTDLQALYTETPRLEETLRELPFLQDVTSDLLTSNPQLRVRIDRDRASSLGITAQQIDLALGSAFGTKIVSQIYAATDQYRVILEVLPKYQADPSALSLLYVRASSGKLVPLGAIATIEQGVGPVQVSHQDQLPSTTISFNLAPGVSLDRATTAVRETAEHHLPDTIQTTFQGTAQVFESSQAGLGWLLLLAVLVIYLVLGILYESFIHPLTVLSGLPSAALGALLTLMLFGKELDVFGFIGLIMLIGIVKKNAIILIDFALEVQRNEGRPALEAIYQACIIRFRPIMMTTLAALAGALPIAMGMGGAARQPLGLAVFGGLLVSQLLTLFLTPVVYLYLDPLQHRPPKQSKQRDSVEVADLTGY